MQQTTVQLIFENWKNLNRLEFDEFMLNQYKTLLREEREQICDAYDFGAAWKYESANNYYLENFKPEQNEQN